MVVASYTPFYSVWQVKFASFLFFSAFSCFFAGEKDKRTPICTCQIGAEKFESDKDLLLFLLFYRFANLFPVEYAFSMTAVQYIALRIYNSSLRNTGGRTVARQGVDGRI